MVIALCYAAIAPLVLGFGAIGLYLFYFAFRYNLMFVTNANVDVSIQLEAPVNGSPADSKIDKRSNLSARTTAAVRGSVHRGILPDR